MPCNVRFSSRVIWSRGYWLELREQRATHLPSEGLIGSRNWVLNSCGRPGCLESLDLLMVEN
jgi:hypothetical protein